MFSILGCASSYSACIPKMYQKVFGAASTSGIQTRNGAAAQDDIVNVGVCQEGDMKNGEMRQIAVADAPVLLVKDKDTFYAVSAKCTHYGASLAKGAYSNGIVRCPWHGACFSVETGDIEDFPGCDSLFKYDTDIVNGEVRVIAPKASLATSKRKKPMSKCRDTSDDNAVVIIGAGAAGFSCAETLRQEGFDGKVILLGKESALPYDRPKLSKSADIPEKSIYLRPEEWYQTNDITVNVNSEVVKVDFTNKIVYTSDSEYYYGYLVIATGGSPRNLTCKGHDLRNVAYLRTPQEARNIHGAAKGKHVVVVGSSFIGMEEAAALSKKAASVTVVGSTNVPFERSIGPRVGEVFQRLLEKNGIKFHNDNSVDEIIGRDGAVEQVVLRDGTRLDADLVVAGIGVVPTTDFLNDTSLKIDQRGYIVVNETMQTNIANIYACGDIVKFPLLAFDSRMANVQHWQMALKHGRTAALSIVGRPEPCLSIPFFWSAMFGKSLRYTGIGAGYDDTIIHGSLEDMKFVCYYLKDGKVVAVGSLNRDPVVAQVAELLRNQCSITATDVERNESDDWSAALKEV